MNRDESLVVGVDVGTSGCKVLISDPIGNIKSESYVRFTTLRSQGDVVEQDAEEWWEGIVRAIRQAVGKLNGKGVEAISISSQGISFIPVDGEGKPLRKAISWLDIRARAQVEELEREIGESELYRLTGRRLNPSYVLPKLRWLAQREPQIMANANKILMCMDYLIWRLCGEMVTDHTLASGTQLYDIKRRDWSESLLSIGGVSRDNLPTILEAGTKVGKVKKEVAHLLGIGEEVEVIIGGQDQKCALFGTGEDDTCLFVSGGTCIAISRLTKDYLLPEDMSFSFCPYLFNHQWTLEGVIPTAGACLNWFANNWDWGLNWAEIDSRISNARENSGLLFFPYLGGAGSPWWNEKSDGVIWGITLSTNRADVLRSIVEGLCFEIKLNEELLERLVGRSEEVLFFGGLAGSKKMASIMADVLNRKVKVPEMAELVAVGAVKLALLGIGFYNDYKDVNNNFLNQRHNEFLPNEEKVRLYDKLYSEYKIKAEYITGRKRWVT